MKKPKTTFEVTGRLIIIVNKTIEAPDMEGAIAKSKTLRFDDFYDEPYEDHSLKITGIWGDKHYDTEQ